MLKEDNRIVCALRKKICKMMFIREVVKVRGKIYLTRKSCNRLKNLIYCNRSVCISRALYIFDKRELSTVRETRSKTSLFSRGNPIYLDNDVGLENKKDKELSVTWGVTRIIDMLTLLFGTDESKARLTRASEHEMQKTGKGKSG